MDNVTGLGNVPDTILRWVDEMTERHDDREVLRAGAPAMQWQVHGEDRKIYNLVRTVGTWPDGDIYWHWTLFHPGPKFTNILDGTTTFMRYTVRESLRMRESKQTEIPKGPAITPDNYGSW